MILRDIMGHYLENYGTIWVITGHFGHNIMWDGISVQLYEKLKYIKVHLFMILCMY